MTMIGTRIEETGTLLRDAGGSRPLYPRSRTTNELIHIGPISPLRQRLSEDMAMRPFSNETQRNYLRDVGRFATWLGRSPHTASAEDVRQFQIEQQQAGVAAPICAGVKR